MELIFHKYQGTGNDFVILDNRDERYNELTNEQVRFLCNRRFGIGADGLMLLNNASGFDFEMETSGIYGLGKLLGHHCLSISAIVANRVTKQFSKDSQAAIEVLIKRTLDTISGW